MEATRKKRTNKHSVDPNGVVVFFAALRVFSKGRKKRIG